MLADLIGARSNTLALLPAAAPTENGKAQLSAEFAQLEDAHRQRLSIAIGVLRAPAKMAYLHHVIADETVSRGVLAWSASVPGSIVAMARAGTVRRISYWKPSTLQASITRILAADQNISDDQIGCKLPSTAVLAFLAILDQLRAVRLYSMLSHAEPSTMFSPAEIMERLAGAAASSSLPQDVQNLSPGAFWFPQLAQDGMVLFLRYKSRCRFIPCCGSAIPASPASGWSYSPSRYDRALVCRAADEFSGMADPVPTHLVPLAAQVSQADWKLPKHELSGSGR